MLNGDLDPETDSLLAELLARMPPDFAPGCIGHVWRSHFNCTSCPDAHHVWCENCDASICAGEAHSPEDALKQIERVRRANERARPYKFSLN